jgi:hypothetical protein
MLIIKMLPIARQMSMVETVTSRTVKARLPDGQFLRETSGRMMGKRWLILDIRSRIASSSQQITCAVQEEIGARIATKMDDRNSQTRRSQCPSQRLAKAMTSIFAPPSDSFIAPVHDLGRTSGYFLETKPITHKQL